MLDSSFARTIADTLRYEQDPSFSREDVSVLAGQDLAAATILGKVTAGAVPANGIADPANTGAGTMTGVTGGRKVKAGVYTVTCVTAVANGGVFRVEDPDDLPLGVAYVGEAFVSPQLNFTLNDVGADFVVGDKFTVTVPTGGNQVRGLNTSGVDGSGVAYGLLFAAVDASASGEYTLAYNSGGTYEIQPGDILISKGAGNGRGRVVSITLTGGSWAAGTAAGTITFDTKTGTFVAAEALGIEGSTTLIDVCSNNNGGDATAVAAVDVDGVAVVRSAAIIESYLVWPSGITAAQKTTAKAELADKGIIILPAA